MTDEPIRTGRVARSRMIGRAATEQAMRAARMRLSMVGASEHTRELLAEQATLQSFEHLVALLGSMKGAAMKLGQALSLIDLDMLPASHRERIRDRLAALHDQAPRVPFTTMRQVIEADLGPMGRHFADFDQEPVAAASIGQVYRARLRDGRAVAVKVQYPGIDVAVRADMKNLAMFAKLARSQIPAFTATALLAEVRRGIESELDYRAEASTQQQLARKFRDHPFIVVPHSVPSLCTRRVLITEYFDGRPLGHIRGLPAADRNRVGELLHRFYIGALFTDHQFCGDPQPGNILLADDGRVAFIDFGLYQRMDPARVDLERRCLCAAAEGRADDLLGLLMSTDMFGQASGITPPECLEYVHAAAGWSLLDTELTITPALATGAFAAAVVPRHDRPILHAMRWPPEHVFSRRAELMVLGVLGQLTATNNWHRIAREWLYGDPPATDIGQQIAHWRQNTHRP